MENAYDFDDPRNIEPLTEERTRQLHEALDALLGESPLITPLYDFLEAHEAEEDGHWPDVWRHAAAYLFGIPPNKVTPQLRKGTKYGCHGLASGNQELRELALRLLLTAQKRKPKPDGV